MNIAKPSIARSAAVCRARRRALVPASLAAVVFLAGCSGGELVPEEKPSAQPTSTAPNPVETGSGGAPMPTSSESPMAEETTSGEWGAYSSQAEACTAVAADVVAVAFLPVSLGFGADQEAIENAEAEIERIKDDAPWVITADFARLQLIVDDYSEAAETDEDASFDAEAFEEALEPIQTWLTEKCENPAGDDESDPAESAAEAGN